MKWADFFHADTILGKLRVLEKSGSWDMGQNTLSQSDCKIFKSTISLEQNDEKDWFFACWYRFMENRSWLKNIGVCVAKNACGHTVVRTLKLAVCQGKMNWNKMIFGMLIQVCES